MRTDPGVVLFTADGHLDSIDDVAAAHLDCVSDETPVPPAVLAIAQRVRVDGPARSRLRTPDGRWLVLYGTRLAGRSSHKYAVLVEPAGPAHVLAAAAYGLSERESQILALCGQGRSTSEIAAELHLSHYTVQDHLKAMFNKVGVRSRRAMVAKLFHDTYSEPAA
jgi:DNA-binding NarL/FixJ family response regulator